MGARGNTWRWRAGIVCILLLVGTLGFAACGNHKVVQGFSPGSSAAEKTSPEGLPAPVAGLDYQTALAELDALACPDGVDTALWAELKGALEGALETKLTESRPGSPARLLAPNNGRVARATKITASPPTGDANRVNDLGIADNGDGTFTLSWRYRNLGDYDQDGVVALEDIIPLAEHFGESVPESDTERNSLQAVIDGSGNGRVGIEDVTPIAQNFQRDVARYMIEGADSEEGPWEAVGEVAQDAGNGEGRLEYSSVISSPAALWHRVVPYDAEGNPGEPSNAVLRPSNEPIIYGVSPISGYQHEECTFTATVSGAEPRAYAWNFGGGATPDVSSASSPTVTLSDAGEYETTLTISNAYGEASFPFTLTVSARDQWAHTWGGSDADWAEAVLLPDDSHLWLVGGTLSVGSGMADILLLKYSSAGDLERALIWECVGTESASSAVLAPDGGMYLTGVTNSMTGEGSFNDVLLARSSAEGDPIWVRAFGTEAYEVPNSIAIGPSEDIYVVGYYTVWGGEADVLIVKFSTDGNPEWARTWGGAAGDYGRSVIVTSDAIYVSGFTESYGAGDTDAFLMKWSPQGEMQWARTWGGDAYDSIGALSVSGTGIIVAAGLTRSYGQGEGDALVLLYDEDGNVLAAKTWGLEGTEGVGNVIKNQAGQYNFVGSSGSFGTHGVLLLEYSIHLELQRAIVWSSETMSYASGEAFDDEGNLYITGMALNSLGSWRSVTGVENVPVGIQDIPEGTIKTIQVSQSLLECEVAVTSGILDTGGGGDDVLLIKNFPR